jgi:hypothetical protein
MSYHSSVSICVTVSSPSSVSVSVSSLSPYVPRLWPSRLTRKEYPHSVPMASISPSDCASGSSERGMAFHSTHDINASSSAAAASRSRIWLKDTTHVVATAFADCLYRVSSRNSLLISATMSYSVSRSSFRYFTTDMRFRFRYAAAYAIASGRNDSSSSNSIVVASSRRRYFLVRRLSKKGGCVLSVHRPEL